MQVRISKSAQKALKSMDGNTKRRIREAIQKLPAGDIKKLQGYTSSYRVRVGDYRILFDMIAGSGIIDITNILPRGSAYKK